MGNLISRDEISGSVTCYPFKRVIRKEDIGEPRNFRRIRDPWGHLTYEKQLMLLERAADVDETTLSQVYRYLGFSDDQDAPEPGETREEQKPLSQALAPRTSAPPLSPTPCKRRAPLAPASRTSAPPLSPPRTSAPSPLPRTTISPLLVAPRTSTSSVTPAPRTSGSPLTPTPPTSVPASPPTPLIPIPVPRRVHTKHMGII